MRNVIVTGGSRGLGLCIVQKLACAGYRVIAVARKETDQLKSAMHDVPQAAGGSIEFVPFDLQAIDNIPELVKKLKKDSGPIYALVNNAAVGYDGILAVMHNSQIEQQVRLNTLSPIMLTKYVVRSMMASGGGGRIVNISSIVSSNGYSGLSVYSATKASMLGFTRSLARELGPMGVNVNSVAPGFLDTEMTRSLGDKDRQKIARRSALGRLACVEDVANAVEYLLSEKAKNITGTVITVDAGNTA